MTRDKQQAFRALRTDLQSWCVASLDYLADLQQLEVLSADERQDLEHYIHTIARAACAERRESDGRERTA